MPTSPEFIATIHEISVGVKDMCTEIEKIVSENNARTIEVPVDVLLHVLSILRVQTHITNRLVEENATIMDLVEKAVRNLPK